ncbi:hypothetical protein MP638_004394 [Amoeboaphelidium occidentale]|nr:hypothetical protein MP638_004394 [Amoeboaphelidium occidentale]
MFSQIVSIAVVSTLVASAPLNSFRNILSNETYSTFWRLVDRTGYDQELLAAPSNITLLAPTNEAFATLPPALVLGLEENGALQSVARAILRYHTLPGSRLTTDLRGNSSVIIPTALQGTTVLEWTLNGTDVYFNDAKVVSPNNIVGGTVVQGIDRVINPAFPYFLGGNALAPAGQFISGSLPSSQMFPLIGGA